MTGFLADAFGQRRALMAAMAGMLMGLFGLAKASKATDIALCLALMVRLPRAMQSWRPLHLPSGGAPWVYLGRPA